MNPIYVDLHIHTTNNPNDLSENYNSDILLENINNIANGAQLLLSLTDHNTINKLAYLELMEKTSNLILGVELHIRNYPERPPYHCHIFFNIEEISEVVIDGINTILNELYPDKIVTNETENVPTIEKIIRSFDEYDFILLPHGGQSHSTFDKSVSRGVKFDTTIEKSIYYNQFDGFTARDNRGLEETKDYFKKLGIDGFVNLVTCTDNYNPYKYPNAKSDDAGPFIPTWMYALPNFNGLRLSLSESSRLVYSNDKPQIWAECIGKIRLDNEFIDIDVELTPGLNVVIGGSSSGKTLFVDSIARKLGHGFEDSVYSQYEVQNIVVTNPSGIKPHYINQNYITMILDKRSDNSGIENIDIIKKVFPEDNVITRQVRNALSELKQDIYDLVDSVKIIENSIVEISRIPLPSRLVSNGKTLHNPLEKVRPSEDIIESIRIEETDYEKHIQSLDLIGSVIRNNPFVENVDTEIELIKVRLNEVLKMCKFELKVREVIDLAIEDLNNEIASIDFESSTKRTFASNLKASTKKYVDAYRKFIEIRNRISSYSFSVSTKEVTSLGHKLYISNKFEISKSKFIDVVNDFLKSDCKLSQAVEITPEMFFESNFSKRNPKVLNYEDFQNRVYARFEALNTREYKIITKEGRDFDELSAGWKTSILLDLILGYEGDLAPLIIDQPEDNLATSYINKGLIDSIKKIKNKKQIILVSHNATIPMLGDAQNIVLCQNKDRITLRSSQLEGVIEGKPTLDYIAEITDGGKSSIKKRVKKYNLKRFIGE